MMKIYSKQHRAFVWRDVHIPVVLSNDNRPPDGALKWRMDFREALDIIMSELKNTKPDYEA